MTARQVAALAALVAACRSPAPAPRRAPRVAPATVAVVAPVAPAPREGFTEAVRLHQPAFPSAGLPDLVVHAPPGFDPSRPFHVVLFAHSYGSFAMQWLGCGEVPVLPGRGPWVGWGLACRHDGLGVNALLVAPQFDNRRSRDWAGPWSRPGYLRAVLDEALGEHLAARFGRALSSRDVEGITLAGSSIGGAVVQTLLAHSDLADRVRNVVLFDAFYGGSDLYARWIRGDAHRRFVSVHGGLGVTERAVAALVRGLAGVAGVVNGPRGAVTDAVRANRAVLSRSGAEHVGIASLYYAKVLRGLDLPALPGARSFDAERPPQTPSATALRVGESVSGALGPDDARRGDGAAFDDYALALAQGESVEVTVAGGGFNAVLRSPLDVEALVLGDDGAVLARDDDGLGRLGARLAFTASAAGRYTVRVTTSGPWLAAGSYALEVRPATR